MQLVAPLLAGVRGAEEGAAHFFARGTSNRATVYSDFEATHGDSSGVLALDSYGGGVAYVDQLVDVDVRNANGETVRRFVAGKTATGVEVISSAFTGTDYETALTGLAKPLTLRAVLDRWLESAGAPDWKVNLNGEDVSIEGAIAHLSGFLRNVKAPEFGALGDAETDDTEAIQACMDAGPGIVVFPAGTYLISDALAVPSDVWLWGVGAMAASSGSGAHIVCTEDDTTIMSFAGHGGPRQLVQGLRFSGSGAPGSGFFSIAAGARVEFRNCSLNTSDSEATSTAVIANAGDCALVFSEIQSGVSGSNIQLYVGTGSNSRLTAIGSTFWVSDTDYASTNGMVYSGCDDLILGCRFICPSGNGEFACFKTGVEGRHQATLHGNLFSLGDDARVAMDFGTLGSGHSIHENGSRIAQIQGLEPGRLYAFEDGDLGGVGRVHLGSRIGRVRHLVFVSTPDPLILPSRDYEVIYLVWGSTVGADVLAEPIPEGARLLVTIRDGDSIATGDINLAGIATPGVHSAFRCDRPSGPVAADGFECWEFVSFQTSGGIHGLLQVGLVET